jgi:hypothetical protein
VKGVLIAACAGGLVLRLIGLQYGLPHVYNPDEVAILTRALSFAKGTLNPDNFLYPTFFFYVLFAWVGGYLALVLISGRVRSLADLQLLYFSDPTGIYTAGRLLGVAAGTATIAGVYRLAHSVSEPRVAAAAAIFMAAAPLHVRDSHYVKHDVPATLMVVLAYMAMLRVGPAPPPGRAPHRHEWTAAAACGAAFSTHYYCVFLAIPLLMVVIKASRAQGIGEVVRRCAVVTATSLGVFFLLSPYIAIEPATVWKDITANRQIVVDRALAGGAFAPLLRYAEMLVFETMGVPVVLLSAAGVAGLLRAQPSRALLLLAFPVPFFLFITNTFPASRYLNPILPFLAVFAAHGVSMLASRLPRSRVIFWLIALGSAVPAAYESVRTDLFIRRTDTRTIALSLIERTVPSGATVALQPYSAPLQPTRESLVAALDRNLGSSAEPSAKFRLQLRQNPWPAPAYSLVYLGQGLDPEKTYVDYSELGGNAALGALRRHNVAYVIVKRYNRSDPETLPFLAALTREGRRLAVVSPYRPGTPERDAAAIDPFLHNTDARLDAALERPGPALEIWQIDGPGP